MIIPQPTLVDHFLLVLLTAVLPVGGWIGIQRLRRRLAKGMPYATRANDYRNNILIMWTVAALLVIVWLIHDRDWRILGLAWPDGNRVGVAVGGCVAACLVALDLYIYRRVRRSDSAARDLVDQTAPFTMLLPHSRRELRWFYGLSLTAGVTEELLYRGFLIAYLGAFVSIPLAIIASSAIFAIAHSYQGLSGSLRTFLVGLALAVTFVLSGSLLFPVIAHALVDLISGRMIFDIIRRPPDGAAVRDSY